MRAARQGRAAPAVPAQEKCLPARGFSVESGNETAGTAGRERRVTSGKDDEEFFRQRGFGIKMGFVALAGLAAWWHQRAKARFALAAGGGLAAVSSLVALFLGMVLAVH